MKRIAPQILAFGLLLSGSGCQLSMPEPEIRDDMHESEDVAANYEQIRLRMRAMVAPLSGEIEQAADTILDRTDDPAIRQAALRWKIEGITALRASLYQPEPLTALFDTWALTWQMEEYFTTGAGSEALGEYAELAAATSALLEAQIAEAAASMTFSGDVGNGREQARAWAQANPIQHSIAARESTLSRVMQRDSEDSTNPATTVVEVTASLDDLNRRLETYSNQLISQARWEFELIKSQLMTDLKLDETRDQLERVTQSAEKSAAVVAELAPAIEAAAETAAEAPEHIAAERAVAIAAMQEELTRAISFLQSERLAVQEQLSAERIAALNDLQEQLREERLAFTADLKEHSFAMIDHAFWRALQLLGIAGAGILILGLILRRRSS